ncbi:MAG: hypothetical protein K2N36_07100, partial [Ruminiclostridium sp.]|nr:hypothetical protein [Ruminiclostridium sp.]
MNDRLKNTVICSFMLMRRQLITLAIIEALMLLTAFAHGFRMGAMIITNDILPLMYLFQCGMRMFEYHTPFCISNAVSPKNRVISLAAAAVTMCLFTSVSEYIIRYAATLSIDPNKTATRVSAGSLVRYLIHANDLNSGVIFFDIPEMFAIGLGLLSLGYFIGSIRYSRGGGFTLCVMFFAALFMGGCFMLFIFLGDKFSEISIPASRLCHGH